MDNQEFIKRAEETINNNLSIDDLIKRIINLIDRTDNVKSQLFEAVQDLLFLYAPEAAEILKERDKFIETLKDGVSKDYLENKLGIKISMGYNLKDDELNLLYMYINELYNLTLLFNSSKELLEKIVKENYLNLSSICDPLLVARLIGIAGSGRQLSEMPSSKIQVLGSEKELFKVNRKHTPRFGVLFKHKLIENAPDRIRGDIAKVIAEYISIAIRADTISKEDIREFLNKKMSERINKVYKKYGIKQDN